MPTTSVELSVVMPCLDEAETLETCIRKCQRFLTNSGVSGEIIIADNGSTDGSVEIAERAGARVVRVPAKGYGNAIIGGVRAARGEFIAMGDADDSYDFESLGPFLEKLRGGYDLVMGNRFQGGIEPGAMPFLHRWLGNPVLSFLGRLLFGARVGDFHCGLRVFRRDAFDRISPQMPGMEFASEMVIKSQLFGLKVTEVPTTLRPDGRSRPPHLRTWRDGWRHLRFMLLFSPKWLFLLPGALALLVGLFLFLAPARAPFPLGPVTLGIHTMFGGGVLCLLGYQLLVFAAFARAFAEREGLHPRRDGNASPISLEAGIAFAVLLVLGGSVLTIRAVLQWQVTGFGDLNPAETMRAIIPGGFLVLAGLQTLFSSFFLGVLALPRIVPAPGGGSEAS